MIDDILRKRHGQKRLDAFYNQPKVKKEDGFLVSIFKGAPYGNTNAARITRTKGPARLGLLALAPGVGHKGRRLC